MVNLKIGLDFYGTIEKNPKAYRKLAKLVLDSGGSLYIISAVMQGKERKFRLDFKRMHLPHTELFVVSFSRNSEIPLKKRAVIKPLHLDFYLDDNYSNLYHIKDLKTVRLLVK